MSLSHTSPAGGDLVCWQAAAGQRAWSTSCAAAASRTGSVRNVGVMGLVCGSCVCLWAGWKSSHVPTLTMLLWYLQELLKKYYLGTTVSPVPLKVVLALEQLR